MDVVYGDVILGVRGEGFEYLFSYQHGGPISFLISGEEWLYRPMKPTFWRATTCNDRGSGFNFSSAMWMGADMCIKTDKIRISVDGEELSDFLAPGNNTLIGSDKIHPDEIEITYIYSTATSPAALVDVSYLIQDNGRIKVTFQYHGKKELPSLPCLGLRIISPTVIDKYVYEGLSGETYPDRCSGAVQGRFSCDEIDAVPYIVPQECGMHFDSTGLSMIRNNHSLKVSSNGTKFAFSVLPYTSTEIENAYHIEELPPKRRTVLCIYGAVRGVGGINSWGAEVEKQYTIDAASDVCFSFNLN